MAEGALSGGHGAPGELDPERLRLDEDTRRVCWWRQWGAYLPLRQWGTVREDYSADGDCWNYFPHDHARSRTYRWGEDGLLGLCDRHGLLCFAPTFWNGRDPILKERLFGLTNQEGNHGEDAKECWWHLEATPTGSYLKALYKYPQREFPYTQLVEENRRRTRHDPEFELLDTGIFDDGRYFDLFIEYAKAAPADILVRITAWNRGPEPAPLHVLPTFWFRDTWSWGRTSDGYWPKPTLRRLDESTLLCEHAGLGRYRVLVDRGPDGAAPPFLFTENATNSQRLFGAANRSPYVKDAFHDLLVHGRSDAVNPAATGTKAAAHVACTIPPGQSVEIRLRLVGERETTSAATLARPFGPEFADTFIQRIAECEAFHAPRCAVVLPPAEHAVVRQAYAGLQWSKQFYCYVVKEWLEGDPGQPPAPPQRRTGRNADWGHFFSRDVISMPDTWEYPWFAAWDLAFQLAAMARVDPEFAKSQLVLFLREWYLHPSGQLPAYEFSLSDTNPPVHAWACWQVYTKSAPEGARDRVFLERCFQKLLINFTWWVNRRDASGRNLFGGGFLGLDNAGPFDRSAAMPPGVELCQSDGTAWMATYCLIMLQIALELSEVSPAYEDVASKFFEHFVAIADAMNSFGGVGLWHEEDGFYYDGVIVDGHLTPLRFRSIVGLLPLAAVTVVDERVLQRLPAFRRRLQWFLANRSDLLKSISLCERRGEQKYLLALPSQERLHRVLARLFDESEFLSPHGVRSLSRVHKEQPLVISRQGRQFRLDYEPGESTSGLFGGNSNWRGPVWFPVNDLLIDALHRYHHFYGDDFTVECPAGSGRRVTLGEGAQEIRRRLASLFVPDAQGRRPCLGLGDGAAESARRSDPHWRDLVWLNEYFNGDTGYGLGASHQAGWTALIGPIIEDLRRGGDGK